MKICYVDEAGCTGSLPQGKSAIQPVFCILGLMIDQSDLHHMTMKYIHLKKKYFPRAKIGSNTSPKDFLDWILYEPKGADLRKSAVGNEKQSARHALFFLDEVIDLVREHRNRLIGRVWTKKPGNDFNGTSVYTSSIQRLSEYFDHCLRAEQDNGFLVLDSRAKDRNAKVSHSIFTQRFRSQGNPYPRLLEMPLFGHSDNHAGLQLCDLLCSGILFPIAVHTFCEGVIDNDHIRPKYRVLKSRFGDRMQSMQYRYVSDSGRWTGGIVCSDEISRKSGRTLFQSDSAISQTDDAPLTT